MRLSKAVHAHLKVHYGFVWGTLVASSAGVFDSVASDPSGVGLNHDLIH